jgi:hypothetical protein
MDKEYSYQKRAQERQREIEQELANRHLLRDARHAPLSTKQAKRLVLRLAPAVIMLTILLLIGFLI